MTDARSAGDGALALANRPDPFSSLGVLVGLASEAAIVRRHWPRATVGITGAEATQAADMASDLAKRCAVLISLGTAGGLRPGQRPGDLLIASAVIDPATAESHPTDPGLSARLHRALGDRGAVPVPLAGSDRAVADPVEKAALGRSGAAAVDMESHHLARAATAHGVPFAVLRVVLDGPTAAIPGFAATAIDKAGRPRLAPVLAGLVRQPASLPALLSLGRASKAAHGALDRAVARLAKEPEWLTGG